MNEISQEEYREIVRKRRTKYGSKKTILHGIRFDSAAECERYKQLLLLERAGAITDLRCQVPYVLQEGFTDRRGKKWKPITYVSDFAFLEAGSVVLEDIKGGPATATFKLKWKLLAYHYPELDLRIVRPGRA